MTIKIYCDNRNKKRKIDLDRIKKVARKALEALKKTSAEINIVFFSNQKIRAINRKYLKKDASTDVIAFPGEGRRRIAGDVAISTDKAYRNAKEYGTTFMEETVLYVIHGILHLAGYDDRSKRTVKIMRRKEDELFQKAKKFL
jgi:probable rRNA maturation factor